MQCALLEGRRCFNIVQRCRKAVTHSFADCLKNIHTPVLSNVHSRTPHFTFTCRTQYTCTASELNKMVFAFAWTPLAQSLEIMPGWCTSQNEHFVRMATLVAYMYTVRNQSDYRELNRNEHACMYTPTYTATWQARSRNTSNKISVSHPEHLNIAGPPHKPSP